MPENEFEKKVSFELQGLKFKPSEPVWLKVEERIRKKKKRRVFIIFFLLAGIALLGYWQWDNLVGDEGQKIVTNEAPVQKETKAPKTDIAKEQTEAGQQRQTKLTTPINKNSESTTNKISDLPTNATISKNTKDAFAELPKIETKKNEVTVQKSKPALNKPAKQNEKREVVLENNDLTVLAENDLVIKKELDQINDNGKADKKQENNETLIDTLEGGKGTLVKDSLIDKENVKKDSVVKKIDSLKVVAIDSPAVSIPKMKTSSWSFGIEFTPGIASFNNDLFSFSMNKSADLNSIPVGGGSGNIATGPSRTNSGFGFQLGGFAKKQLTKRSSLTVGLRWAYYSDKINIGSIIYPTNSSTSYSQTLDRLGTSYAFSANGTGTYNERFHFIEIPAVYQVQLNKSTVHPFSLQFGLKMGRLLSGNAIAYDTAATGIYYRSTKYLNKTQFGFITGVNWKINKSDKMKVMIGPVFDLHLNSFVDNPYDKKKFLLFTGLRTSILFNSKK